METLSGAELQIKPEDDNLSAYQRLHDCIVEDCSGRTLKIISIRRTHPTEVLTCLVPNTHYEI